MADFDVIVIGSGLGGLSAGALLAKQGRKVLVLEQGSRVGGCCSTFERDGFSFDLGASILEIPEAIERTFEALGTRLADEVGLVPVDPIETVVMRDGERIRYPAAADAMPAVLGRHFTHEDARAWSRFVRYFDGLTDVLLDTVFSEPAGTMTDMTRMILKRPALVKYLPGYLTNYEGMLRKYFSGRLVNSFAFQSMYFGLPPDLLPGVYALLAASEHRGMFYVRGGMIELPEAFRRVGERYGMQVRFDAKADRIMVENGHVAGVRLADGTEITSRLVVSNVNAKITYQKLVGEDYLPRLVRRGVRSYRESIAVPMVFLGLDYKPPLASHHTIVATTTGELNAWWRERESKPFPDEQWGLVSWTTHSDPSLAPAGKHVLNVTTAGTYRGVDWDVEKKRFVDDIVEHLSRRLMPGLAEHVQVAECATPFDFEQRLGLAEGGIYGLQQDVAHGTVFRPSNRSKSIGGLYLAGASTNPGGGITTVVASGWITSRLIERYEG